jgi:broad-specificity NMP kinase
MGLSVVSAHKTVVLEGCDGVGKTTLAQQLALDFGFTIVHSARTPDGVDLIERYQQILARPERLVLDRSFVSELVYGPLHHGGSRLTHTAAIELATLVAHRDGVLAHLTAPASVIQARLLRRDGPGAAYLTEVEFLTTAYESVITLLTPHIPVVRIDTR